MKKTLGSILVSLMVTGSVMAQSWQPPASDTFTNSASWTVPIPWAVVKGVILQNVDTTSNTTYTVRLVGISAAATNVVMAAATAGTNTLSAEVTWLMQAGDRLDISLSAAYVGQKHRYIIWYQNPMLTR